ncbi:hypothetical protein P4O66_021722, partial [Electrophorus voltai]
LKSWTPWTAPVPHRDLRSSWLHNGGGTHWRILGGPVYGPGSDSADSYRDQPDYNNQHSEVDSAGTYDPYMDYSEGYAEYGERGSTMTSVCDRTWGPIMGRIHRWRWRRFSMGILSWTVTFTLPSPGTMSLRYVGYCPRLHPGGSKREATPVPTPETGKVTGAPPEMGAQKSPPRQIGSPTGSLLLLHILCLVHTEEVYVLCLVHTELVFVHCLVHTELVFVHCLVHTELVFVHCLVHTELVYIHCLVYTEVYIHCLVYTEEIYIHCLAYTEEIYIHCLAYTEEVFIQCLVYIEEVSRRIAACLTAIASWMTAHHLKLNPSKTELLFIP